MSASIACVGIGGMETFGEVLRRRRLERHWTQRELGREIGVSRDALRAWESDRRMPSDFHRRHLAAVLGLDPSDDRGWWA